MKTQLLKSVIFGWLVTIIGIWWPILTYTNPDKFAPQIMWDHIPNIFLISALLLVLRYSMYGPILNTAKNAAKITIFAFIIQFLTTGSITSRLNPLLLGAILTLVVIMLLQIMYLVFVCWYYLTRETIELIKLILKNESNSIYRKIT